MEVWMLCVISVLLWVSSAQLGASLNQEGLALLAFKGRIEADPHGALSNWDEGADNPCLWFGVECSDDGEVVVLKLRDLHLKGTITPEIGMLTHARAIILHNNSLYGLIPVEIGRLKNLELLDLSHNNFSGPLPSELVKISSLQILLLRSNAFSCYLSEGSMLLETQIDEVLVSSNRQVTSRNVENATIRRLLQDVRTNRIHRTQTSPPSPAPSPTTQSNDGNSHLPASPTSSSTDDKSTAQKFLIVSLLIVGAIVFLVSMVALYFLCYRANKAVTVMPWTTGLSGQLQKAFVTGVPSLKRSELETACEQFSNIIDSSSNCTLCKGTLSSGVEIAVTIAITSAEDWKERYEVNFRNKIDTLSKVNHKNFMNLIGYCEEEKPFTRMMVFEYASNGTVFEHLHIKEAEQLDWAARLRVIMGIAYCLQHMEQLNPPLVIRNLSSSSIYLTEDCAAKISDLEFWNEEKEAELAYEIAKQNIVYKFGIVLLEIISGRLPFSEDDGLLVLWASSYLNGKRPLMDMVDRTLTAVGIEHITELADVIRSCINVSPEKKPTMTEVVERLRGITSITPDEAYPRVSPLWWAELEIISQ
ncbi:protein MALE DISCOVERER 2-like isoform X1 [Zingiber officinale]|uniref:protein MALE DISCOVERER 2-like isoform X1 n=1 Tax=Zingiber officinale TaxID=94328 RepID=UPI001C4B166C|nr:protein MALE DISCOVERER 2-like isoform X1 [Zingiber officinale]XP_042461280.1 protein MALE DISCOVERER 2-like isoform X1 [Zingiber officinale]